MSFVFDLYLLDAFRHHHQRVLGVAHLPRPRITSASRALSLGVGVTSPHATTQTLPISPPGAAQPLCLDPPNLLFPNPFRQLPFLPLKQRRTSTPSAVACLAALSVSRAVLVHPSDTSARSLAPRSSASDILRLSLERPALVSCCHAAPHTISNQVGRKYGCSVSIIL
jgi:hypothetical protein